MSDLHVSKYLLQKASALGAALREVKESSSWASQSPFKGLVMEDNFIFLNIPVSIKMHNACSSVYEGA